MCELYHKKKLFIWYLCIHYQIWIMFINFEVKAAVFDLLTMHDFLQTLWRHYTAATCLITYTMKIIWFIGPDIVIWHITQTVYYLQLQRNAKTKICETFIGHLYVTSFGTFVMLLLLPIFNILFYRPSATK